DPDIGRMRFRPRRHDCGQAVENQLTKARIVFGEIVDFRLIEYRRLAPALRRAIEIRRAVNLERKRDRLIARIDICHVHQTQGVLGEIAILVDFDEEGVVLLRIRIDYRLNAPDLNSGGAPAARDGDVFRATALGEKLRRNLAEKVRRQRELIGAYLDIVEPVESLNLSHRIAAIVLLAAHGHKSSPKRLWLTSQYGSGRLV